MVGKAAFLIFLVIILILLYACLCASAGNENEQYWDDWAQAEWCRERGKEGNDGTETKET